MNIQHTRYNEPYYNKVADKLMDKSLTKEEIVEIITDYAAGVI